MVSRFGLLKNLKEGVQAISFPAAVKVVYCNIILFTHIYTKSQILEIQSTFEVHFEVPFICFSVSSAPVKIQG